MSFREGFHEYGRAIICFLAVVSAFGIANGQSNHAGIDYTMAERGVDWIELINSGADDQEVRDFFMDRVAPTDGCKSIIRHWARFMEWNDDLFLKFILEGIGKVESDRPLKNEDGSLTGFGKRKMLWENALANPDRLREDIAVMKKSNVFNSASTLALKYLPEHAELNADFCLVLFGGSNAYSVGDVNGFDLLQMPRKENGSLDIDEVIRTFAHELHHTGFAFYNDSLSNDSNFILGVLAAEGMPTFFIDGFPGRADIFADDGDKIHADIAKAWKNHQDSLAELYPEAENDLQLFLEGKADPEKLFGKWMGGIKGQAYVLGADMYSLIDKYLGTDDAISVISDFRKFLVVYNKAAQKANAAGDKHFIFDKELAERLARS